MFDSTISLACSMHAKKGVYALLLGSGISRASGIPTGWEITLDLISKIASTKGKSNIMDYESWYIDTYGIEPDYSDILDNIAKTPSERNQILKDYFEPSNASNDEKIKKPTKAHKAIAKLIKNKYIRFIITTNFDRLLEKALIDLDLNLTVISTEDQLKGSMPIIHSDCTILKIHGDYLDTRIKNTKSELTNYSKEFNSYIDRIFDEFGLIVCGWSAEWDIALRNSIYRNKSNRFTTYWLQKGKLTEPASKIIKFKKAEIIKIDSANTFFVDLLEKISSLEDLSLKTSPLSVDMACATLKRWIPDVKNRIKVDDMVIEETKSVISNIFNLDWSITPSPQMLKRKVNDIESICEKILHITAIGCYWGEKSHHNTWINMFSMFAEIKEYPKIATWKNLFGYPGYLILKIIIIICMHKNDYKLLYYIMNKVENPEGYGTFKIYSQNLISTKIIKKNLINTAFYKNSNELPLSKRVKDILFDPLSNVLPNESTYQSLFYKAEYFTALNYWFNFNKDGNKFNKSWAPHGLFLFDENWDFESAFEDELKKGQSWEAIQAGFFKKSLLNFRKCNSGMTQWFNT